MIGWKIISEDGDGGLLIESPAGHRKHIWHGGEEIDRLRMERDDALEEVERLRAFYDSVIGTIHEHAGAGQEFAYIWQNKWDEIKSAVAAKEE